MKRKENKSGFAPSAKGLGGAARRTATTLAHATRRATAALAIILLTATTAWADDIPVTAETTTMSSGTYRVTENVTVGTRITIDGDVTLILGDGTTLTANKGIELSSKNKLTIEGNGTLTATSNNTPNKSGIGAQNFGTLIINGGNVNATGYLGAAGIGTETGGTDGGSITINGGVVTAVGGHFSAGIGGCYRVSTGRSAPAGNITINGGQVHATGEKGSGQNTGIGIGNGWKCSNDNGSLTLGWTAQSDYIYAQSYSINTITFARPFVLENTETSATKDNISGQKIVPSTAGQTDISTASVGDIANQKWTGYAIKPSVTVTIGGTTLVENTDYYLTYSNNVNVGTEATVTIFGQGLYYGSTSKTFTIVAHSFSGAGTAQSPYLVQTAGDLMAIAGYVNSGVEGYASAYYRQTANLDMTGCEMHSIGGATNSYSDFGRAFSGTYDGGGYTISHLTIAESDKWNVGLFGNATGATIKSVVLDNTCTVNGHSSVGGLIGYGVNNSTTLIGNVFGGMVNVGRNNGEKGALIGRYDTNYSNSSYNNYYTADATPQNAYGIAGSRRGMNFTDNNGAVKGYAITLTDGVELAEIGTTGVKHPKYAASGETVTPIASGTARAGYIFGYTVTPAQTITDGTFTMPAEDVTVGATWTIDPAHFSVNGAGTEYTIHSTAGWSVFCDCLDDNDTYNRFSGKTVRLGADITVSRMAGSQYHDFCGTFDGQQHTLTFNYGTSGSYASDEYAAPFHYVSNVGSTAAAFRNLHVAGDIYTSAKYAAGLIAQHWGTVNVENCRVSTVIHSSVNGDGTHGGFEAESKGVLNITGCVFDGKLLATGTTATNNCGGFVGWHNGGTTNISNSLYAPAAIATGEREVGPGTAGQNPSATFGRNAVNSIANSYYTRTLGTAQGKQAHSITASGNATLVHAGEATEYSVSGITAYKSGDDFIAGIIYNNVLYAGSGDAVSLTLRNTPPAGYKIHSFTTEPDGATLSSGSPSGDGGAFYTLTMPNADITIGATWIEYEGDGTAEHPYVIYDWNIFCGWMTNDYDNSKDKYYMLGADVSATTMVGTSDYPFCGTFDGNGHTLTLDYGSAENPFTESFCAPFRYVSGTSSAPVVIKNLHVAGNMNTIKAYGAGFVGKVMENGKVTIENCRSSVDIESTRDDDAFHSGFVSRALEGAIITIKDCVFDGSFKAPKCKRCAGFFASSQPGTFKVIENCLFAPTDCSLAEVNMDDSHRTFARGSNYTITNCYYTQELGGSQGEKGILLYDGGVPATANEGVIGKCINEQYDVKLQGRTLYKDGDWNTLCLPFALGDDQAPSGHELYGTPLEGATLMTLGNSPACNTGFDPQTGTLNLDFLPATTVEPGVAYIVKWGIPDGMTPEAFAAAYAANPDAYDLKNPVFTAVTVTNDAPADHATTSDDTYVTFVGTYGPAAIYADPAVNLYLGAANKLYWPSTAKTIGSCRAYFQLNGLTAGEPAPAGGGEGLVRAFNLNFGEDDATGIVSTTNLTNYTNSVSAGWYDLSGRKLQGKPTKKGLYINNGRKVVIK